MRKIVFNNTEMETIKNMYLDGNTISEIGKSLNISSKPIRRALVEMGVEIRPSRSVKTTHVNDYYFDEINTQNKAYILGFLYADGCNHYNNNTISLSVQDRDFSILERINREIDRNGKIYYKAPSMRKQYICQPQWSIVINSEHMSNTLTSIGMTPRKTFTLEYPNIDSKYNSHFIRGYFDGDGCITSSINKNGKYINKVSFISTYNFCKSLQDIIRKEVNISCGGIYAMSKDNNITKYLNFAGDVQVNKFYQWLYKDADMYLERKYQKFVKIFGTL